MAASPKKAARRPAVGSKAPALRSAPSKNPFGLFGGGEKDDPRNHYCDVCQRPFRGTYTQHQRTKTHRMLRRPGGKDPDATYLRRLKKVRGRTPPPKAPRRRILGIF